MLAGVFSTSAPNVRPPRLPIMAGTGGCRNSFSSTVTSHGSPGATFVFPAVHVGGAGMPQNYVAFPIGSEAARAGAGGVWTTDEAPAETAVSSSRGQTRQEGSDPSQDDGNDGIGAWILPLLGVVLAGAGVAAVTRRGSR